MVYIKCFLKPSIINGFHIHYFLTFANVTFQAFAKLKNVQWVTIMTMFNNKLIPQGHTNKKYYKLGLYNNFILLKFLKQE